MKKPDPSPAGKSWDTYWRGTGDVGAYTSGGASHPAVQEFWTDFFGALQTRPGATRMIDLATGNGAVIEIARSKFDAGQLNITCVDLSSAAIENVGKQFPGVSGIVADVLKVPLADGGFDLATSQFGIEYAGVESIYEAVRLLDPGAHLAMLMHIDGGSVFQECQDSHSAIRELRDTNFLSYAEEFFAAGFSAVRGADRAPYDAAGRQLAPAVEEVEAIMARYGEHVAGDTLARLYDDVARIHNALPRYDRDEVLGWLDTMNDELDAYSERMLSMIDAALDKSDFEQVRRRLSDDGLEIQRAEPMIPAGERQPLAWALVAMKQKG